MGGRGMREWAALEAGFRDLLKATRFDCWLDHQYGAAGEYWHLEGIACPEKHRQLVALARIAGRKILELPPSALAAEVLDAPDALTRWYRALHACATKNNLQCFTQIDATGRESGHVFHARVYNVLEASAALCMTCESIGAVAPCGLDAICSVPRYAGPGQHWMTSKSCLRQPEPDYSGAVREAVHAVEGMCRVLLADETIVLGDALKRLRTQGRLSAPLAKCLDGLWGFANTRPGIRHGATTTEPGATPEEARFVAGVCEQALQLLLAADQSGQ